MAEPLKIAQIAGDGIGPEVVGASLEVLKAAAPGCGLEYQVEEFPFSAAHFLETGHVLDDQDIQTLRGFDSILLGAVGGLPNDPRLAGGVIEKGILLKLRFELDQYINLRPVTLYPGIETPLKDKTAEHIDFVCVRENTEDLYCGVGGYVRKGTPQEVSNQTMVATRFGVERCIRYAFELAKTRQRKNLTLVHKTNVLTFAGDTWHRAFKEVSEEYPEVETNYHHVDACCMFMVQRPEVYDVIVVPNMFGDIITDLGAMVQGGMGIAASGNIHPGKVSLFEPIHGSAPKHAGKNVASPVAAIMAASMMLDYIGEKEAGKAVEDAVRELLVSGRIKGVGTGVHPTSEVGDMVVETLRATAKT